MALHTTQVNGNPVGSWVYNDFLQLLTGAMNDQPVSLKYTPGNNTNPALRVQSDGTADLLRGYLSNGTTVAFTVDANGNASFASLKVGTVNVALQGAHSAGQPIVSYGTGAPASLAANEVFFQLN